MVGWLDLRYGKVGIDQFALFVCTYIETGYDLHSTAIAYVLSPSPRNKNKQARIIRIIDYSREI